MTREVKFREADLSIVLPGTWASLPLGNDEAAEREIAALVRRQVGRDDRLARLRRDAKEQLRGMVAAARLAGAFRVGIALEILPGVPFPAAMILDYAPWPVPESPEQPDRAERLRALFPSAEILELGSGTAARTAAASVLRAGSESTADVKLQYWLPTREGDRLLHITVDAPTGGNTELYTDLFDAIVDSIRWFDVPDSSASA
ncbi:hypothetical protein [Lacisediminihabitans sp.]|uniref:hypothetical protein n=1 Tax=Lacisediminihabitans sp. TaxID=2787631 RepID=UPI00374CC38F